MKPSNCTFVGRNNEINHRWSILLAALLSSHSYAGDLRYSSVIIDGNVYSNVTISRVEYDEAVCLHTKGILRAGLADLPASVQSDIQKTFAPMPPEEVPTIKREMLAAAMRESLNEEPPEEVPTIESSTDEFDGVVTYMFSDSVDIHCDLGALNYRIEVHVDTKTNTPRPLIVFDHIWGDDTMTEKISSSLRDTWPHSENRSMILLIDGTRTDLGDFSYRNNIITYKNDETLYNETMWATLSMATLNAMSRGTSVRIRLGKHDYTLLPNKRVAIKSMCDRLAKDYPPMENTDVRKTQE